MTSTTQRWRVSARCASFVVFMILLAAVSGAASGEVRLATVAAGAEDAAAGGDVRVSDATAAGSVQAAAGQTVTSPFGLNAHLALRFEPGEHEDAVEQLAEAATGWIREEFNWAVLEPLPGDLTRTVVDDSLRRHDSAVRAASAAGVNILGLLTYGPNYNVNTGDRYEIDFDKDGCPAHPDASAASVDAWLPSWRAYVRTIVTRYQDQIHYWEIQNEPNVQCFWRKVDLRAESPDAAEYAKVLRVAYETIQEVTPDAKVVFGGLPPGLEASNVDAYEYVKRFHDAGGWKYFDILAVHPYRAPAFPEQVLDRSRFDVTSLTYQASPNSYNLRDEVAAFGRLMASLGSKPVWITEIGWAREALKERAAQRGSRAELVQSDYLIRSYIEALAAGAQVVMWYDFRDDNVPENPTESSYGIVGRDGEPKPAYYAFSTMAHLLTGSKLVKQVHGQQDRGRAGDDDVHEYRFADGGRTVVVLWKSQGGDDASRRVTLKDIPAPEARVFGPDYAPFEAKGGRLEKVTNDELTLPLTERPLFVVFDSPRLEDRLLARIRAWWDEQRQRAEGALKQWWSSQRQRAEEKVKEWWSQQQTKLRDLWQKQLKDLQKQLESELQKQARQLCGAAALPIGTMAIVVMVRRRR